MNIYSLQNRFLLEIDAVTYEIREPVGWDQVRVEMSRDFKKYRYGFTDLLIEDDIQVEFSEDPSNAGNRSYDLLRDKFNTDGTDSVAVFFLETELDPINNPGVFTTTYTANVDFDPGNFEIVDRRVKATLKTISFEDKFNSRLETLVDINSNIDLDGNAGTIYSPQNIKLHSKAIRQATQGIIQSGMVVNTLNFEEDLNEIEYEDGSRAFAQSANFSNDNPAGGGTTTIGLGGQLFASTESRSYEYTISINAAIFIRDDSPVIPSNQTATLYLVDTINGVQTRTLVSTSPQFQPVGQTWFVNQSYELVKSNNDDDATSYTIEIDITPINGAGPFFIRNTLIEFSITIDTLRPETTADLWTLDQVGSRIVEATTGQDVYQSDILTSGCAQNIGFTNGRFIKNQNQTEFNPKTSMEAFINTMGGMFNIGYGFEGTTVRHEPIEHYFQDVEVLQITNADLKNYSESAFSELFYNKVKIGYNEGFDQELFYNDDPHGDHEYLLPLVSPKNTQDYRVNYIASMYAIEQKRREQFLRENNSNKFDDDIFIIKLHDIDEYDSENYSYSSGDNEFVFNGEYYDIDAGDDITITAGPPAGTYTVGEVNKEENKTFVRGLSPPLGISGNFVGPFTIELNTTKTVPWRDETYASVSNLIAPETAYNLMLTPKALLFNQSLTVNSILSFKPGTDIIRNQFVKNNGNLTLDPTNSTEMCNHPTRDAYQENADIAIEDLNLGNKLFTGRVMNVRAEIGFDNINLLMDANRNQLTGPQAPLNRGFVTVTTPDAIRSGWIYDMKFQLNMEVVEMRVLEKA